MLDERIISGVIVADKPAGCTSHDVVSRVKKTLGAKKVGHLGTLDPLATGVLPLVINGATKYAERLSAGAKTYMAKLKLGETTDTYDSEGRVQGTGDISSVSEKDILDALSRFKGAIMQTPPMFSAKKRAGVPLYKLARAGITVERQPKEVFISNLDVLNIKPPYVEFTIECSKGTYVRSICHDAGISLGCGAHLTGLRRVKCGVFTEAEAISPASEVEALLACVIPLDVAMDRLEPCGETRPRRARRHFRHRGCI
ncbi:MAG: tRNA pseudouridine(55) synthase TruB [Deltaproteobacteria bacterium]|nr:tRNA pseudouridine(55) synthase TruB [Deltaproteobacteria bacterium]